MTLALGPFWLTLAIWGVFFDLRIGFSMACLEIGPGDGRWFNAYINYDDGQLHWQVRRGVVRHYLVWGEKSWEGSRYWTDADLPPAKSFNLT